MVSTCVQQFQPAVPQIARCFSSSRRRHYIVGMRILHLWIGCKKIVQASRNHILVALPIVFPVIETYLFSDSNISQGNEKHLRGDQCVTIPSLRDISRFCVTSIPAILLVVLYASMVQVTAPRASFNVFAVNVYVVPYIIPLSWFGSFFSDFLPTVGLLHWDRGIPSSVFQLVPSSSIRHNIPQTRHLTG